MHKSHDAQPEGLHQTPVVNVHKLTVLNPSTHEPLVHQAHIAEPPPCTRLVHGGGSALWALASAGQPQQDSQDCQKP